VSTRCSAWSHRWGAANASHRRNSTTWRSSGSRGTRRGGGPRRAARPVSNAAAAPAALKRRARHGLVRARDAFTTATAPLLGLGPRPMRCSANANWPRSRPWSGRLGVRFELRPYRSRQSSRCRSRASHRPPALAAMFLPPRRLTAQPLRQARASPTSPACCATRTAYTVPTGWTFPTTSRPSSDTSTGAGGNSPWSLRRGSRCLAAFEPGRRRE